MVIILLTISALIIFTSTCVLAAMIRSAQISRIEEVQLVEKVVFEQTLSRMAVVEKPVAYNECTN